VIKLYLKKVYKTLNKIIKELKWRRYKLKLIIKRIEKKNLKPFVDLGVSLHKSLNLIEDGINEIEEGLRTLRSSVIQGGLEAKLITNSEPKTQDTEVYEVLLCSIKLHIKPEMLIYVLRSCFIKRKVLILLEDRLEYLKDVIIDFFNFIFEESFEKKIKAITKGEYTKEKDFYTDYIVLTDNGGPVKDKNQIFINETKFEEEIIREYYRETDTILGRKNLRYKLQDLYALSKALFDFYEKRGNILVPKAAIRHLEDTFFLKIKKEFFYFLVDIVKTYFDIDIKYAKDYVAEQIALLMGEL